MIIGVANTSVASDCMSLYSPARGDTATDAAPIRQRLSLQ